jgi:drug/metabolite transporter (DMT)-like permease
VTIRAPRITTHDAALLALVIVWAVNLTMIKDAISGPAAPFTPLAFNALRFVVAAAVLFGAAAALGEIRMPRGRAALPIVALGLVGNFLYQMLFILGMQRTSPANSALILALVPAMVAIIAVATGQERLRATAWLGILLSFAGIGAVVLGNDPALARSLAAGAVRDRQALVGDALVMLAAIAWSGYTVLAAPLLRRDSATTVTTFSLAAGTVPLIAVALPDLARTRWSAISLGDWGGVVFSGALALGIGYVVWNRGVKHLGGSRTAIYSNLNPVFAAVIAWAWRGDRLTLFHVIGGAAVLAGINMTRAGRRAANPLPAEE